eukprot:7017674-Pyramimonas_sp.AAC.1
MFTFMSSAKLVAKTLAGYVMTYISLALKPNLPSHVHNLSLVCAHTRTTRYILREPSLLGAVNPKYQSRCRISGDLFLDAVADGQSQAVAPGGSLAVAPGGGTYSAAEAPPADQLSPKGN